MERLEQKIKDETDAIKKAISFSGLQLLLVKGASINRWIYFIHNASLGGLEDRISNGNQFGQIARRKSWLAQIEMEKIEALDIYWYATHNEKYSDGPRILENRLLQKHLNIFGYLPKWNKEL